MRPRAAVERVARPFVDRGTTRVDVAHLFASVACGRRRSARG